MFWPDFSRIIEHDKGQETTHKDPYENLTITVEVTRSIL